MSPIGAWFLTRVEIQPDGSIRTDTVEMLAKLGEALGIARAEAGPPRNVREVFFRIVCEIPGPVHVTLPQWRHAS